jgi:UDP-N-acetylglucosamine--N-acetylmuramyl-(pentapeptide) pyrophosphoryl-undecaprenol N-acetylglucosamine transferase
VSVILAGWILRKKVIIHSADSVMGLSNKILCRFANKILTSFENVKGIPAGNNSKIVFTGLPLRENILKLSESKKYKAPSKDEKINIIITGGSQGSAALGKDCAIAFSLLDDEVKSRLNINHQVRKEDIDTVLDIYENAGLSKNINCEPFFDNMSELYKDCHLFIGRSGASSVVENALLGVPSIFIPLWHKDRQQFLNAEQLTSVGGALMIEPKEYSSEVLKNILNEVFDGNKLLDMNKALSQVSIKNGSVEIPLVLKEEF